MASDGKRTAIVIGIVGIAIELTTLSLLRTGQISSAVGKPMIIIGMLMAFVPLFLLARRSRR